MGPVTSLRCSGDSNTQHELYSNPRSTGADASGGCCPSKSGQIGGTFQSLIFKRLTLQSNQMTQYVDVETERLINEALEIAEDIKISIDNDADLINMDWIVKDTTNFTDKVQTMVDAVLGHLPGEIKPVDDKMMCFRVLTLIVYAAKIYLAVKDSELRTFIELLACVILTKL